MEGSLAEEMEEDRAGVGGVAVFPEIDALPGAKGEAPLGHRDREVDGGQGGSNMSGHVVIAFSSMAEQGGTIGHEASKECFEVAADIGVGVFLDQERGGGVADMKGEQASLERVAGDPGPDLIRDFIETATTGGDFELVLEVTHRGKLRQGILMVEG